MATAALPIEPAGAAKAPDIGVSARRLPQSAAAARVSFIVLTNVSSTAASPLTRYCWRFQARLGQLAEPLFRLPKIYLGLLYLQGAIFLARTAAYCRDEQISSRHF
jgi:hypothetical protein